ncbi:MAG TPA: tyrosine-type recombinase/integrase [Abditibacteriaceae bacterium]|jgi:hypothetical protein
MQNTAFDFLKPVALSPAKSDPISSQIPPGFPAAIGISVAQIEYYAAHYLEDCECVGQSVVTVRGKKDAVAKLLWFLHRNEKSVCTVSDLRQFLIYLQKGHRDPGGRWGQENLKKPVSQRTVRYYYTYLQGLFKWFVQQGVVSEALMEGIQRPPDPTPPIHVFTDAQVIALLEAAARSQSPHRNIAFLLFLLDTGARVSEACSLTNGDLNFSAGMCEVLGKGKKRELPHHPLWQHGKPEGGGAALHQRPPRQRDFCSDAQWRPAAYSETRGGFKTSSCFNLRCDKLNHC